MNVTGHVAVAARLGDDPAVWLGAALPDLAGFARHRLLGATSDPAVTAGIALHHRTDDAFHRSPWFRALQDELRPALERAGLGRGAARAVAHVGPELLLDRTLVRSHGGDDLRRRAIDALRGRGPVLAPLVTSRTDDWLAHLELLVDVEPPFDAHVGAVARRLHRILSRRPRLAFDAALLDDVAALLGSVEDHIDATAEGLVAAVAFDADAAA